MKPRRTALVAVLLLALAASLATLLEPWFQAWAGSRTGSANLLSVALGDSRRLFAKHFYVKADAYFHSGYYPSIFDRQPDEDKLHMAANAGAGHEKEHEMPGHGAPQDWITPFGRHFAPSVHTHLGDARCNDPDHDHGHQQGPECKDHHGQHENCEHCKHHEHEEDTGHKDGAGEEREILPWLKLAATLDPERPETYVTAAFWLRSRLNKPIEAEQFLREGLQHNPQEPALLFELGRIYREDHKDPERANRILEIALTQWRRTNRTIEEDTDRLLYIQMLLQLAKTAEEQNNLPRLAEYLKLLIEVSPAKGALHQRLDEISARANAPAVK